MSEPPKKPTIPGMVADLLREAGPLSVDDIAARLVERGTLTTKNPKNSVRNAIQSSLFDLAPTGDGRYCFLPTFVQGTTVRMPMDLIAPETRMLAVGSEVANLLWLVGRTDEKERAVTLHLVGGPEVAVSTRSLGYSGGLRRPLELPAAFWRWWEPQQASGADTVLIHCEDAELGLFTGRAVLAASLDATAVAERNARLREMAPAVLKGSSSRGMMADQFVLRMLARGVYHSEPPPDPLYQAVLVPQGTCLLDRESVVHRPDFTAAWQRVFAPRFTWEQEVEEDLLRRVMGLPLLHLSDEEVDDALNPFGALGRSLFPLPGAVEQAEEDDEEEWEANGGAVPLSPPPATQGYRIKVSLEWDRSVWRIIEILDKQTFHDLHNAIQVAFDWDNDHLYAFFLSGRPWDSLTELASPFADVEPPAADEVYLAEAELQPKQKFLYIFDFGDELRHIIEVVGTFPVPAAGEFPRIAESHGKAPPQYGDWDGDEEAWEDEDEA